MALRKIVKILLFLLSFWGLGGFRLFAHPMPNSIVLLNIHQDKIEGKIQLPLGELQSAIGLGVNDNTPNLVNHLGETIKAYLLQHIHPISFDNKPWSVSIGDMNVVEIANKLTGDYKELIVTFSMQPPQYADLRNFYFKYDVIVHQVVTHKILLSIKQDWQQGIVWEDSIMQAVGVIELDIPTGKIKPFQISLQAGSNWQGFKNMVSLGIGHIWRGTDHILFILTLLLAIVKPPSSPMGNLVSKTPLLGDGGLLGVITAFTIAHSLTLLLGSVQWINLPRKPIEVLIAITISVSAFHAFRPIYPKKETLIAGAFGLIHGLAFAETLTNLQLSTKQMALSILGFNIGIELMQLLIILVVFPILILLNKTRYYLQIRQIGAIMMMILALAWMIERLQDKPNFITKLIA